MAPEPTLPPGPRLPRLVQTLALVVNAPRFLTWAQRRYGDVVTLNTLLESRFVLVLDPELVRQVLRASPQELRAGEANARFRPLVGDRSLFLLDGDEHLRDRRLLLPPLHGARLKAYDEIMREVTDREIDSWPVGEPFELLPRMWSLTLDVMMRAVFGEVDGARYDELRRALRGMVVPLLRPMGGYLLWAVGRTPFDRIPAVRRFERERARVHALIADAIARRRADPGLEQREDVFSTLLLARTEDGEPMPDRAVRDELITLLSAGHATSAAALAWTFDLLLHDEPVLDRLRESLRRDEDDYLDAVVKESLRVRTVSPATARRVRGEPFALGPYAIPPGVAIKPSIASVHALPGVHAEPAAFRPERFLGESAADRSAWIPFGGGVRRCIGASFVLFEMRAVVARVLERASLAAVDPEPDAPEPRGIAMVPRRGVRVLQTAPPLAAGAEPAQALRYSEA